MYFYIDQSDLFKNMLILYFGCVLDYIPDFAVINHGLSRLNQLYNQDHAGLVSSKQENTPRLVFKQFVFKIFKKFTFSRI